MTMKYTIISLGLFSLAFAAESHTSDGLTTTNTTEPATCYNLDGSESPSDVPCGTGSVVNCCNENDICMSNGLCYQQGDQGMSLSRGSCTDRNWGPSCYAPCPEYSRDGGIAITNFGFDDESEYCCGGVVMEDADDDNDNDDDDEDESELSCELGEPFSIPPGTAIPNIAGLSHPNDDEASDAEHEDDDDNDHDSDSDEPSTNGTSPGLAVALGVGIPLGLILMSGVLWPVWERRRRHLREEERRGVGHGHGYSEEHLHGHVMRAMHLPSLGLHHRYGPMPSPVPSYPHSVRGTPNHSGIFHPLREVQTWEGKSQAGGQEVGQIPFSQSEFPAQPQSSSQKQASDAQSVPEIPLRSPERALTTTWSENAGGPRRVQTGDGHEPGRGDENMF